MIESLGLTATEVADRRAEGLGNNEVRSTSRPLTQILRTNVLTRFNAILAALLAIIIVVGPFQDGLFGVVLVVNTAIGVGQEWRAKRTLDRLAVLAAPHVRVWRDGVLTQQEPAALVVGDVVAIDRGDQIPLDGTIVTGTVEVDESLLSGESDPASASPGRTVLSGSFVVSGSANYRVDVAGSSSYAQRLAGEARRFTLATSELRDGVNRFLQLVQWALVPVGGLLVARQLLRDTDVADAIRGFVAGVSAMIPEGLILLTSVAFAIAVVRLARRRVLVQELPAVEGLARVDVLCLDKTGTLTLGGIEVDEVIVLAPTDVDVGAALAALAAMEPAPNPTLAAIGAAYPAVAGWDAVWTSPFSSARRWSAGDFGAHGVWVLGAPDLLAPALEEDVAAHAALGHRVVLLARAGDRPDPTPVNVLPVALVVLSERVKPDAAAILRMFRDQGVAIKVMSGDHPMTVAAVAAEVGLDGADQVVDASACGDELADLVHERSVFGRVSPQQKRLMVASLKARGHTVAMTGDGVNDVLALKDADIGVAMGSGSAVTRGVAQLILLDDSFGALAPVIAEGRRVIANVERVANLFISKTVYATLIALAVAVTGSAYPFLPRHLTVISDLTIGVPAFILALQPNPAPFHAGFVGRVVRFAVPCGAVVAAATLGAYYLSDIAGLAVLERRTVATLVVAACSLVVLTVLARPLDVVKTVLVVAMGAGLALVLAVGALRTYFALSLPPGGQIVEVVVAVLVAIPLIDAVGRRSRRDP